MATLGIRGCLGGRVPASGVCSVLDHHNTALATLTERRDDWLDGRLIGIEKESLRTSIAGTISQRDHPSALGAALTHPHITTDFGEAMLEFVTPPGASADEALAFLLDLHAYTVGKLNRESLWATSMPCVLQGEDSVRIGEYGDSNVGRMKHVYRQGLGLRYGKSMQVIAFNNQAACHSFLTDRLLVSVAALRSTALRLILISLKRLASKGTPSFR